MRKVAVATTFVIIASTVAWALEVQLPVRAKAKATVVVDLLGRVIFDEVPGKVGITNTAAFSVGTEVLVDRANALVGEVLRVSPSGVSAVNVSPGGVAYLVPVTTLGPTRSSIFYDGSGCTGTEYVSGAAVGANFYITGRVGFDGVVRIPLDGGSSLSYASVRGPTGVCDSVPGSTTFVTSNLETVDWSSFLPPFHVAPQT